MDSYKVWHIMVPLNRGLKKVSTYCGQNAGLVRQTRAFTLGEFMRRLRAYNRKPLCPECERLAIPDAMAVKMSRGFPPAD